MSAISGKTSTILVDINPWDSTKKASLTVPNHMLYAVKKYTDSDDYNKWLQSQELLSKAVPPQLGNKRFYEAVESFNKKESSSVKE